MTESKFQFKSPELVSLNFELNSDFDEDTFDGMKIQSTTSVKRSESGNSAYVTLELNIDGENVPFVIRVSMGSMFSWSGELDKEMIDTMLQVNAPSLLLSYIRPIVTNVTANSRYSALYLPFMDMSGNKAVEEE